MTTPLERLDGLEPRKRIAFLGLFAGARLTWNCYNGEKPMMGKSECEWVNPWRDFYERELPSLGLSTFEEGLPRPALGMAAGSNVTEIRIGITELGWQAREAYWARLSEAVADPDRDR